MFTYKSCIYILLLIGALCLIIDVSESVDEDEYSDYEDERNTESSVYFRRRMPALKKSKTTPKSRYYNTSRSVQHSSKIKPRNTTTSTKRIPTTKPTIRTPKPYYRTTTERLKTRPTWKYIPSKSTTKSTPRRSTTKSTTRRPTTKSTTRRSTTKSTTKSTTTRTTKKTTTTPISWPIPTENYNKVYGGLAGSGLGIYLGAQVASIKGETALPAYSVRHYWHQDGVGPLAKQHTLVDNRWISNCSSVKFSCLSGSERMCLSSGKVYCLARENQLQSCNTSSVKTCFPVTVRLPCNKNSKHIYCMIFDWHYQKLSIPCLTYMKVNFTRPSNGNDMMYNNTKVNNNCICNTSTSWTTKKGALVCASIFVNNSFRIFCSGLNLSRNFPVSTNATLDFTNAYKLSCQPTNAYYNFSINSIYGARNKSLLSRCTWMQMNNSIDMMCGNSGHLINLFIPNDTKVFSVECTTANMSIFTDLKVTNHIVNPMTCPCNTTRNVSKDIFQSSNLCVYIAAYPTKLYSNKDYLHHLSLYKDEQNAVQNNLDKIMSAIGSYFFF